MFKIQKFDLLISIYIFCICVSELMGAKTTPIFQIGSFTLNVSVAILILPFVFSINDIVAEVFGADRARSMVRSGLIIVSLILVFSLIVTALPPSSRFSATEPAYDKIFSLSARISAASLTAFAIAEFIDVFIFVKIRQKLGKKALWLRTNISNIVSQFLDTSVFMVLAFYSFDKPFDDNFAFLISLILPYWLLKCLMSFIETPLVYLGIKWIKEK